MSLLSQWERGEVVLPDDRYTAIYAREQLSQCLIVICYRGERTGVVLPSEFGEVLE